MRSRRPWWFKITVDTGLSQRVVIRRPSNLDRTGFTRVLFKKYSPDGQAVEILSDSPYIIGRSSILVDCNTMNKDL